MGVDQINIVNELKRKVKLLAKKLDDKHDNYQILFGEKLILSDKLKAQEKEISELKQQNNTLRLSSALVNGDNSSEEAKVQINNLVREIDKCIALLNR